MSFKHFLVLVLIVWFGLVIMGAFTPDQVVDYNATLDWPTPAQIDG